MHMSEIATSGPTEREDALRRFDEDGYVIFRDVIDPELVAETSGHMEWLSAQHPELRPEQLGNQLMTDDPFWVRLVSDPRLLDVAELFIGPDIALFASHYISKPAFSGQPVLWHQDAAYWPLDPMEVVTCWLAVDHSTEQNGCVRVIPGSHKSTVHGMHTTGAGSVLGSETDAEIDESQAVSLELAPGDVEVHHPNILHSSLANESSQRRCGLTIRYIPTSTMITSDEQPFASAFHLQGNPGGNQFQPTPLYVEGKHYPFRDSAAWA
jgi:ectoine hydroxylase-related dioxygenase (phytanoyl-CoA dioxygenase family)